MCSVTCFFFRSVGRYKRIVMKTVCFSFWKFQFKIKNGCSSACYVWVCRGKLKTRDLSHRFIAAHKTVPTFQQPLLKRPHFFSILSCLAFNLAALIFVPLLPLFLHFAQTLLVLPRSKSFSNVASFPQLVALIWICVFDVRNGNLSIKDRQRRQEGAGVCDQINKNKTKTLQTNITWNMWVGEEKCKIWRGSRKDEKDEGTLWFKELLTSLTS